MRTDRVEPESEDRQQSVKCCAVARTNLLIKDREQVLRTLTSPKLYMTQNFPDRSILDLGQQAASSSYANAIENGLKAYNAEASSISFRIYLDPKTGLIKNYQSTALQKILEPNSGRIQWTACTSFLPYTKP
jgi:hypothetical protein